MDTQQFGCTTFVTIGGLQCLMHGGQTKLIQVKERQRIGDSINGNTIRQLGNTVEHVRLFDHMRELADIAGPVVLAEAAKRFRVWSPDFTAIFL